MKSLSIVLIGLSGYCIGMANRGLGIGDENTCGDQLLHELDRDGNDPHVCYGK